MKPNRLQKHTDTSRWMMKLMLVILSTALVVYFMPREDEFGYKYEEGKPWNYGLLIADSKFPILKSDSLLHSERARVERDFQPYYLVNTSVKDTMLRRLHSTEVDDLSADVQRFYVKHISAMLDTIYNRGVISIDDYAQLTDVKRHRQIRILSNNYARSEYLSKVFTPRTAYRYIMEADTSHFSRAMLQHYNINELIQSNLSCDEQKTKEELSSSLHDISNHSGTIEAGQKIIDRGETVTKEVYNILRSYQKEYESRGNKEVNIPFMIIGQSIFVFVIFSMLTIYLSLYRDDYFDNARNATLIYALPVCMCIIASIVVSHKLFSVFILPVCFVAIVIRVFMDSRTAFMNHCAMLVIISITLSSGYEFLILQLIVGMAAIHSLRELTQRSQIVRTSLILFLVYSLFYTGYSLYHENGMKMDYDMYTYFAINCVLLLFAYPLLWMLEKLFGFTSDVTLVELSNMNNPLLRRMTEVAPGTFQHSVQVANLSAEVANKIGAKAQLVRTGALYHDIGKMERPVFFTENQNGISPHKHLTPLRSAQVIIAHVTNGIAMAEKNHIPEAIKRFILTHHGRGKAKYFYITYRNEHPDENIDEEAFTYPGPNPSTKEEAILMMCDAVEAASRSLQEYTEESINTLVDRIIDSQVAEGFFSDCSITFKDIAVAKNVLKEKLKTIYHTRITYPELNEEVKSDIDTPKASQDDKDSMPDKSIKAKGEKASDQSAREENTHNG